MASQLILYVHRMQARVAIPKMDASVAPRFETADSIVFCTLVEGQIVDSDSEPCAGCEGISRVRLLREHQVDTVICNGIRSLYRNLLQSLGVVVIDNVSMTVDAALEELIAGRLNATAAGESDQGMECAIPHEDLICWADELLSGCGWRVEPAGNNAPFAVDLVATTECPVCHRQVRAAVCCGAHIYRCDREIGEFHHSTMNDFHVRLYVHPYNPKLDECCHSYGIQLIDPHSHRIEADRTGQDHIAPIIVAIGGHDRLKPMLTESREEDGYSKDRRERG